MDSSLEEAIRSHASPTRLPDGMNVFAISLADVETLSRSYSQPGWLVEATALESEIIPVRYQRNMNQISTADQMRLLRSSVAQVGLGGLGGTIFDLFLRTGVGRIRAADGDCFEESNLNRQALSDPSSLGIPKAITAKKRAARLNPSVETDCQDRFLSANDLPDFLSGCDIVIDALGGLKDRQALQRAAADANLPMVTGALAGWTGYVCVVHPGQPGPADFMGTDNAAEELLGCSAPAVSVMASIMATQAIFTLTGNDISPHMLIIDLKSLTFEKISL